MDVPEHELQDLYTWVDEIPLSRPKRNIARDFSDGVMAAEAVLHFFPRAVELHNYSAANSVAQKMYNWNTLNAKVFSKLGFALSQADCEAVVKCAPLAAERVLNLMRHKFTELAEAGGELVKTDSQVPSKAPHEYSSYKVRPDEEPSAHHATPAAIKAGNYEAPRAAQQQQQHEQTIRELKEMNEILETKTRKLEQLVRLKDAKIQTLLAKLNTLDTNEPR